jgi:hypothetical protein
MDALFVTLRMKESTSQKIRLSFNVDGGDLSYLS